MHTTNQSQNLREAIKVLCWELPEILGSNYQFFIEKMNYLLKNGNDYQIFDLVDRYPEVRRLLIDTIVQLGLFGYPDPSQNGKIIYRCPRGPHCVKDTEVVHRDAQLKAICPRHNIRIVAVKSCP